jgi:hypothetical protein
LAPCCSAAGFTKTFTKTAAITTTTASNTPLSPWGKELGVRDIGSDIATPSPPTPLRGAQGEGRLV